MSQATYWQIFLPLQGQQVCVSTIKLSVLHDYAPLNTRLVGKRNSLFLYYLSGLHTPKPIVPTSVLYNICRDSSHFPRIDGCVLLAKSHDHLMAVKIECLIFAVSLQEAHTFTFSS